jgi:NAD(P)-dependent dehydrogenase (short-subunit alcohol dehydrogenase family)
MRFADANVLIAGGGSGIGLACARRFLAEGATPTIAGRDEERLRRVAAELAAEASDREVRWLRCDVTVEDDVAAAVARAAEGGGLHAVVTAAGTGWVAPVATIPLDAWQRVVDTNLTGAFLLLKHAAGALAAMRGTFTAISSVNAVRTSRFHAPYNASKAALEMLVHTAADELGGAGVRVNAVRPGLVPTALSSDLVADAELRTAPRRALRPVGAAGPPWRARLVGCRARRALGDRVEHVVQWPRLADRPSDHPTIDARRQAALRRGQELARRQLGQVTVAQAQQQLPRRDLVGGEIHDRLCQQRQPVAVERLGEPLLHRQSPPRAPLRRAGWPPGAGRGRAAPDRRPRGRSDR